MSDVNRKDRKSVNNNRIPLLLCAAGVLLNLSLGALVGALGLPLYLDTVGSVIVGALGGYLPGVLVGFFTNMLKTLYDPTALYYGVLNVLIAFVAAFWARRGWIRKVAGYIGMFAIFVLIGGGIGSLIPWFMNGLTSEGEALAGVLYETLHTGQFVSHLLASIIMDIPDKAIIVVVAAVVIRLIPEKYHQYFRIRGWMQKPISDEEATLSDKALTRVMPIKVKILIVVSGVLAIVSVVAMIISMEIYRKTIIEEHARIAQGTTEIAAGIIDADMVNEYLEKDGAVAGYQETENLLARILQSSADIEYLYVYKITEEGCYVVFDIDTADTEGELIGTVIPIDEGFREYLPALLSGERIDPIVTNDRYGYLLTAYQPVYDSNGRCVCYVGADVDMGQLNAMRRSFLVEMISVYLGFFIVLCVFVTWLTEYHIIYPVNTITRYVNNFSFGDDRQEILDEEVREFRDIGIRTGDEIEKMYSAISNMTLNQAEQMRSIRRLSEATAKMQDGLIITMADMVENRDSDTGAHIQKTAAYVKIIVEGLKRKGYYAEKITNKFMSDVVRSAPLHDVGKINIPDEVLNKPGKLTDEEYEIMKTHTTAGKHIMEKAIGTVEGGSYLKEARNMAAYHHERWDGRGYPEGLHGEVIPLSARIMAVADVFDALTSPRVYKPAFTIEKALSIIEEGKGTQFDPKCVEVFMDSLPEVQVILKKYAQNI